MHSSKLIYSPKFIHKNDGMGIIRYKIKENSLIKKDDCIALIELPSIGIVNEHVFCYEVLSPITGRVKHHCVEGLSINKSMLIAQVTQCNEADELFKSKFLVLFDFMHTAFIKTIYVMLILILVIGFLDIISKPAFWEVVFVLGGLALLNIAVIKIYDKYRHWRHKKRWADWINEIERMREIEDIRKK